MNWMDPHSALLLFKKKTENTNNKHCARAVREKVGMVSWKVLHRAIHLLLVSQDTEYSPPGT